jgi:enoyl-CoA hydratase/carnithine racemase
MGTAAVTYHAIEIERSGSTAIIRLNRPEQLNAWDWRMSKELRHAYAALDADDDVRAIVLTGAGRAFCAGAGLVKSGETFDGTRRRDEFDDQYPGPSKSASELLTPLIAAINGAAVGAGITLAMAADIRVVAEDAKLGFVFNRRGVMPDADLLWSLPRTIGYSRAMDLLLTGRMFNGREAVDLGLATRAVPTEEVLPVALEIARDIAENVAPVSAAITRLVGLRAVDEVDRDTVLQWQRVLFAWTGKQPDAVEGVRAFLERRPPVWKLSKNKDLPRELLEPIMVQEEQHG